MKYIFSLILCVMSVMTASAQFRLVDAENGLPIAGAYVFSSSNKLLCMSDADGMVKKLDGQVTISILSYESKTVDASTTGDVALTPKSIELPEVVVQKTEYQKVTGAFRDIFRNDGKTVLYREGIMDLYIDLKSGKSKRFVRACRQYELPKMRGFFNVAGTSITSFRSFDPSRFATVSVDSVNSVNGDTTTYSSHYKDKAVNDGMVVIEMNDKRFQHIIFDNIKFAKKTELKLLGKTMYVLKEFFSDYISDKETGSIVAYRSINNYDSYEFDNTSIPCEEMKDFVVMGCTYMTKKQAKEEMKDKTETSEFPHPDCLPEIPYDVEKETADLVKGTFWER